MERNNSPLTLAELWAYACCPYRYFWRYVARIAPAQTARGLVEATVRQASSMYYGKGGDDLVQCVGLTWQEMVQEWRACGGDLGPAGRFCHHLGAGAGTVCELENCLPIPTGFTPFDEYLESGLHGEDLWLIGGMQNIGKTVAVLQMARNIARSGRALAIVVCYEHSPVYLLHGVLCLESIDLSRSTPEGGPSVPCVLGPQHQGLRPEPLVLRLKDAGDEGRSVLRHRTGPPWGQRTQDKGYGTVPEDGGVTRDAVNAVVVEGLQRGELVSFDWLLDHVPGASEVWQKIQEYLQGPWLILGDGRKTTVDVLELYVELAQERR